jgi:hypothetical protein
MSIIWQNTIAHGKWEVKIHAISDEVLNRGILKIYTPDGELVYEKEVGVDRRLPFGGTAVHMTLWRQTIDWWVLNSSSSRPPAAAPEDLEE